MLCIVSRNLCSGLPSPSSAQCLKAASHMYRLNGAVGEISTCKRPSIRVQTYEVPHYEKWHGNCEATLCRATVGRCPYDVVGSSFHKLRPRQPSLIVAQEA